MNAIEFTYVPELADYWSLNWYVLKKQVGRLLPFGVLSILVFLASPSIMAKHTPAASLAARYQLAWPLLILPTILVLIVSASYWGVRKRWSVAQELREAKAYRIDSEGVRVTGATFEGFLEWNHFSRAHITGRFIYLQTHQGLFYFFPISAVPDSARLQEFIKSKVKV